MINKEFYKRNLPHIQPLGATFFVTYNLHGSIPREVLKEWASEYEKEKSTILKNTCETKSLQLGKLRELDFAKRNNYLDNYKSGNHYLKDSRLAKVVADSLHFWDNKLIELICYCIMSNHVHLVLRVLDQDETDKPLYLHEILKSIKQYSARRCNQLIGKSGPFWLDESFDVIIRDHKHFYNVVAYVLDNPISAGLCKNRSDWQWSYIKSDYDEFM